MAPVLVFWSFALLLALLALPIAARIFRRFPDAGAGLAFPLGLMLCGYGYFLLRTIEVLPHGRGGFLLAFAGFALISAAVAATDRRFIATLRRSSTGIIASFALFTVAFFAYAAFRSYNSGISGTEQPMDFLFLNAMLASPSYPPADPWLAGHNVSYYYFGYLQSALLTGASGVEPSIGYNLGLATVFASAAAAVASVCAALVRWVVRRERQRATLTAAALGVALLLFSGSLLGVFEFAAAHERYNTGLYEAFGVESLLPCEPGQAEACYAGPTNPRTQSWYPDEFWFWWRASRVIPDTITEFPAFSFILGDLHPHVMALPGVILAVAIALALWRGRSALDWRALRRGPLIGLLLALVFGGLAFQNTWDVLTFSAVLAGAVLARNWRVFPPGQAMLASAAFLALPAAAAVVLYSPWWLDFGTAAGGLHAHTGRGTIPAHAFLQFGTLILAALLVVFWAARRAPAHAAVTPALYAIWVPIIAFAMWALLAAFRGDWSTAAQERTAGGWTTLLLLGLALWALCTTAIVLHLRRSAGAPVAFLAAVGVLLLYGAELLLIRDVFFGSVPRLNTMFKLSYQAWVLLSIAGAVAFVAAISEPRRRNLAAHLAAAPVALLLVLSFAYVAGAVPNRTNGFGNETNIDGLAFLARNDPDEYALTRWIASNTPPGAVIIEASGRRWQAGDDGPTLQPGGVEYTDAGRIASRTGRLAPIGWYFHQVQWRGDNTANREEFSRRQDLVDGVYLAGSQEEALAAIAELGAGYVVMGRLEQARYPSQHRTDFDAFLDVAFEAGDLRVYRVPRVEEVPVS